MQSKQRMLRHLLIIGTLLISTACATQQRVVDLEPNLPKKKFVLPKNPSDEDYWSVMVGLRRERNSCYDDLERISESFNQLNRRWYQFWK